MQLNTIQKYYSLDELALILGSAKNTLRYDPSFPKGIKVGKHRVVYDMSEVQVYLESNRLNAEGLQMGATKMIVKQDEISVIKFDGIQVRIITHMGEPWFNVADVCKALEIKNATNAIQPLDEQENTLCLIKGVRSEVGNPIFNIVSELGFYKLTARSQKATQQGTFAYQFTNWVFGKVIPTIRKTGTYGVPWAFLNDYTKREQEYKIESSKRGRDLEECKKIKAHLIAEGTALWKKYQP